MKSYIYSPISNCRGGGLIIWGGGSVFRVKFINGGVGGVGWG